MANPPKYRKHSSRNRAFIEWQGRRHYLPGPYGSDDSKAAYRHFLREHALNEDRQRPSHGEQSTVADVVAFYLDWAEGYYPGGNRSELTNLECAAKPLLAKFAALPAKDFGPLKLKEIQRHLIDAKASRNYINSTVSRIKRMFKWAVSEELIPADIYHALQTVPGLARGRTTARETSPRLPVPWEHVELVLAEVGPTIKAMLLLQWHTGVRSGSICRAMPEQFDRSETPWLWYPRHKTEFRGKNLVVPIGPAAREVLAPFLDCAKAGTYLFSPRAARANPRYRKRYEAASYKQAVSRAIDRINAARAKADPPQDPMPPWVPHQIRHSRGTLIRARYGLEAAQASLGHDSIDATQLYAEKNLELAKRIAQECG